MLQKYPRTFHVPWSPGATRDDRVHPDMDMFFGKKVVVTEKMDGENTTIYKNYIHARSLTSGDHPSRSWVKSLQGSLSHEIPDGMRICGENLFARHSIAYDSLDSYFMVFSIWDKDNICLDWDSTLEWCELLELIHVPILYTGVYDEKAIKGSWRPSVGLQESEGYVIRLFDSFHYDDFEKSVAKYVRKSHVKSDEHWMYQEIIPNKTINHKT